jgi:phage/plasmid-associated DNA primase
MYVSRALRGMKAKFTVHPNGEGNYDENDMVELLNEIKNLNLLDAYKSKIEILVTEAVYDEAAKFACMNFDKYVCIDITKHTIFVFRHNMWQYDHGLRWLTQDIVKFAPIAGKSHKHRNELIKDVCHHLYANHFLNKLGEYKAINFCGSSFDYTTGEIRNGNPNDYTSISTGFPIQTEYRNEVEKMIHDIFPDESIYRYFMRFAGSLLIPGNRDKIFMVWSGTGDNGKSVLSRLIELALGEYAVKLPTSLVTGKRTESSAATPEMVIIEKKLVAFLQEPGQSEKLNIGIVKELTGNDSIYVRGLYENGKNISIKAKIIYIVNSTDNLATIETAVWNRIVVLPFVTHFTSQPKFVNDRKKDLYLNDKLKKYAGSLLGLMIDQAREYMKEGLLECETITKVTEKVMNDNDHMGIYLQSDMDQSYTAFVSYMKQFASKENIPSLKEFEKRKNTSSVLLR